jgi:hypothetical protein
VVYSIAEYSSSELLNGRKNSPKAFSTSFLDECIKVCSPSLQILNPTSKNTQSPNPKNILNLLQMGFWADEYIANYSNNSYPVPIFQGTFGLLV